MFIKVDGLKYLGLAKRKGRYVFTGLPGTGKSCLIQLLIDENQIDALPWSDDTNCRATPLPECK